MNRAKLVITLLFLPIYLSVSAQSLSINWKEGDIFTHTSFDNKGNIEEVESSIVTKVATDNDKTIYTITSTATDGEGNPININAKEKNNTFSREIMVDNDYILFADLASLLKNAPLPEDKGLTITTSGELPCVPRNPQVGTLPDTEYCITFSSGKMSVNTKFKYTKRKVIGRQVVKTECGEFNCWKISEKMSISMLIMKQNFICTTWVADNIGIVQQEITDNSGKLQSRQCLTEFKRVNK